MNITFPLILDGAMGTQLIKRGLPKGSCPEKWILENPDAFRDVTEIFSTWGMPGSAEDDFSLHIEKRYLRERFIGVAM